MLIFYIALRAFRLNWKSREHEIKSNHYLNDINDNSQVSDSERLNINLTDGHWLFPLNKNKFNHHEKSFNP